MNNTRLQVTAEPTKFSPSDPKNMCGSSYGWLKCKSINNKTNKQGFIMMYHKQHLINISCFKNIIYNYSFYFLHNSGRQTFLLHFTCFSSGQENTFKWNKWTLTMSWGLQLELIYRLSLNSAPLMSGNCCFLCPDANFCCDAIGCEDQSHAGKITGVKWRINLWSKWQ